MFVLWVFGVFNVLILLAILWRIAHLEVQMPDANSPQLQVKQALARQAVAKLEELEEAKAILPPKIQAPNHAIQAPNLAIQAPNDAKPKPKPAELINRIEYGIPTDHMPKRTPVVMIRSRLPPNILARFEQSPLFNCSGPAELEKLGLKKTVDYPKSKDTHTYYEGFYHSLETTKTVLSRNARNGKDYEKPPAGDFLRAFYEGFRRANNFTFEVLRRRLYNSAVSRHPRHPYNDTCGHVARWLEAGMHFSDLSVQIHWGSHIGKQTHGDELFWHSDAENSLLHFCVTIRGSRTLHSMRALTEEGKVREVLEEQRPGDMYLSSSALMRHAPEYPETFGYGERIAAIQARFLYLTEELKAFRQTVGGDMPGWTSLTHILADTLSTAKIVSPSIAHIDNILKERRRRGE